MTITKSITIDGGGSHASILASSVNGVIINSSTAVVKLRNLSINGATTGLIGVKIFAAADVYVENCSIFGFKTGSPNGRGISDQRTNAGKLFVTDSMISNNGHTGIVIAPTPGQLVYAALDNVRIEKNGGGGLSVSAGAQANVNSSVAAANVNSGFSADGSASLLTVTSSLASGNGVGVTSQSNATVLISNVTITNNGTGVTNSSGGALLSYGDNAINANGVDGAPSGGLAKQ